MSASIEDNSEYKQFSNTFAFQHFDKESDFGYINEQGERVRKRKTPGRKPNPPSLQQKRAINRVAQKSFREREQQRKDERDKERQIFNKKIKDLQRKLAVAQFEARYLKACVLHLSLDCLKYRGSVPHIWSESRIIPGNTQDECKKPLNNNQSGGKHDEANEVPALLDMMLEDKHIVDFDKATSATTQKNTFSNFIRKKYNAHPDTPLASIEAYIIEESHILNRDSQQPEKNFPPHKDTPPADTQSSKLDKQQIPSTPLSQDTSPAHYTSSSSEKRDLSYEALQDIAISSMPSPQQEDYDDDHGSNSSHSVKSTASSQELTISSKPLVGVIHNPPSLKTSNDFVDMPALQALHILRLQLKLTSILGNMVTASLLPTALQRVVPHDMRIDYIPSAAIRDRMIIFQDYYDMDNCFQYLTNTTVFMGGDVRDSRNWVIDPAYSMKYWFICHQLVDHNYDDCIDMERVDRINKEYMK